MDTVDEQMAAGRAYIEYWALLRGGALAMIKVNASAVDL